jgi:hypothetical protein
MPRYFVVTKTHSYSLLFALPLLLLYEAGAAYIATADGAAFRNGADVLLRTFLLIGGIEGTMGVTLILAAVAATLILRERRHLHVPMRLANFFGMALESICYASLLGIVVGWLTQWVLNAMTFDLSLSTPTLSLSQSVVLSLGAGVYEELVFRVILVGGLFGLLRFAGLTTGKAGTVSVCVAALVFSAFHYVGPYGDPWALPSFVFRFIAGVAFSALYLTRGFGIAAWTHALYDVIVTFTVLAGTTHSGGPFG